MQANVSYVLGQREHPVNFGYGAITSAQCLDCHARHNERHPIYRFNEPRFAKALAAIKANTCLGCHSEHSNQRSFVNISFCKNCHADLELKNDPLNIAHTDLIANKEWGTCMGCHSFHGNYPRKAQISISNAFQEKEIEAYLNASPSPYGPEKIAKGKKE